MHLLFWLLPEELPGLAASLNPRSQSLAGGPPLTASLSPAPFRSGVEHGPGDCTLPVHPQLLPTAL